MRQLNEYERTFALKPVGVKYICEFCGEGEQKVVANPYTVETSVMGTTLPMIGHICTKCGKEMLLPRIYPYIEWVREDEEEK